MRAGGVHIWSVIDVSACREGPTQAMVGASQAADPKSRTEPCPSVSPSLRIPLGLPTVASPPRGWLQTGSMPLKRAKGSGVGGGHGDSPQHLAATSHLPAQELAGPPAGTRRPPERSGAGKLREREPCPAAACTSYLKLSPPNDKGSAGDLGLPGRGTGWMGAAAAPWGHRQGTAAACREMPGPHSQAFPRPEAGGEAPSGWRGCSPSPPAPQHCHTREASAPLAAAAKGEGRAGERGLSCSHLSPEAGLLDR